MMSSKQRNSKHTAIDCLAISVLLFLLCSCASFDIGDWPSRFVYPQKWPVANLCGPVGSYCAYYLLYYIGPGIFAALLCAIGLFSAKLARLNVGQPAFRVTGLLLLTAAVSAAVGLFWPESKTKAGLWGFPVETGGVIGVAAKIVLTSFFASLGATILLLATFVVGIILIADNLLTAAWRLFYASAARLCPALRTTCSVCIRQITVLSEIWRWLRPSKVRHAAGRKMLGLDKDMRFEKHLGIEVSSSPANSHPSANTQANKSKSGGKEIIRKQKDGAEDFDKYALPPIEMLSEPQYTFGEVQSKVVKAKAKTLEDLLAEFNVNARVVAADSGPVVTMFELELAAGVKVSRISALSNDMARALGAGAVRVVAPLPGKHTIGIEVPNSEKEKVRIKDLMQLAGKKPANMQIPLFLGKDSGGEALVSDLTGMPHLLIAGTTGSGKSVCINSVITGILLTKRPDEMKMILIDPKMVEFTNFNNIPHLMCPIVTETQKAVKILEWATVKMDERYALLAEARVKNLAEYNKLDEKEIIERFQPGSDDEIQKIPKKVPNIVIIIDELADLMMTAAKEIEAYIVRLAQKSRAVGIHLVIATQRPQATVVTGLIKSNMPTRIGFRVAARMDSRIILDQNGAETLLGQGDMLFLKPGTSDLVRAQGTFVDDAEIRRITRYLKEVAKPQFHPELTKLHTVDTTEMTKDELFDEAARVVIETKRGSVSLLQRRLSIGYARASRIIEMMAAAGILGEYKGSQAREVLLTLEKYERLREKLLAEEEDDAQKHGDNENGSEEAYVAEGQRGYASLDDQD